MSFAEPGNRWEGEEDFDSILNILDFPIESLGDDGFVADWDVSKSHCLGPIPSDVLMGPPTGTIAPISKQDSFPHMIQPNKAQESGVFQTQSPVSVLENSGSSSAGKNLPNPIPVRARSKRSKRLTPWLPPPAHFTSVPRKGKNETRKSVKSPTPQANTVVTKRCTHCDVTKTPQWREGPLGPKTLCNACGVRYRSGRLFPEYRPAASPTFVAALHSNSHKKVVEMRSKGKGPMVGVEKGPDSPQPEFVPMSKYLFDYMY